MRRSDRRQPDGPAPASICTGKKFNSCFDHFRHGHSTGRLAGAESAPPAHLVPAAVFQQRWYRPVRFA
jgi:hypothetical protein